MVLENGTGFIAQFMIVLQNVVFYNVIFYLLLCLMNPLGVARVRVITVVWL
jgi:hypothetical protein